MSWFVLVIISAFTLGLYDFCKKHAVANNRVMPVLVLATFFGSVFMLVGSALSGHFMEYFSCSWQEWCLVMVKAILVASSWIAGYFALHDLPITLVAPIRASAPVWATVGGLLLFGERPTYWQFMGMAVVFCGYLLFTNIGRMEGFSWRSRGVQMAIASTLLGASSALYDRWLMYTLGLNPNKVQLHFAINTLIVLSALWLLQPWLSCMREDKPFKWRWSIPLIGLLVIAADWTFFHAVASPDTQIGMLSVLRRCSVAVSFICGMLYFRERRLRDKAVALILVLTGVIIIGFCK